MKGRSLFGPFLLIALGAGLLAHNVDPEFSLADWFADFWPWILIAWGCFRIVEHIAARALGVPPPNALGAGAIVMGVLLCLTGTAFRSARQGDVPTFVARWEAIGVFSREFEFPIEESWPIEEGAELHIRGFRGELHISAEEGASVRLDGSKLLHALNRRRSGRLDFETKLGVTREQGKLTIESPAGERMRRVRRVARLRVPASAPLFIEDFSGELSIDGSQAEVTVDGSGALALSDLAAAVKINMRGGRAVRAERLGAGLEMEGSCRRVELADVEGPVRIEGNLFERIELKKIARRIEVVSKRSRLLAQSVAGRVEIGVGSITALRLVGPVHIETKGSQSVRLEAPRGPVEIVAERGTIRLIPSAAGWDDLRVKLGRGEIEFSLDPRATLSLEARVENGRVVNRLGGESESEGSGSVKIETAETPKVRLDAGRGTITLQPAARRGEQPLRL